MTAESWASSPAVRKSMQGNRSKHTSPELELRRLLHAEGLRYRLHNRPVKGLRRTADVVFGNGKVAVELQGCYWHGCPEHFALPATNRDFWRAKINRNRERDAEFAEQLAEAGWMLVTVWEHDHLPTAAALIAQVVRQRRTG